MTTIKTIGEELTIVNYSTKQKGYGRQALYLHFLEIDGEHYIQDVFPNVKENFRILLNDDSYLNEDDGLYYDANGNYPHAENELFDTVEDFLNSYFAGDEIEIEEEEEK